MCKSFCQERQNFKWMPFPYNLRWAEHVLDDTNLGRNINLTRENENGTVFKKEVKTAL